MYPQPLACPELPGLATDQGDAAATLVEGSDDFTASGITATAIPAPVALEGPGPRPGRADQAVRRLCQPQRLAGLGDVSRVWHRAATVPPVLLGTGVRAAGEEYGLRLPVSRWRPAWGQAPRLALQALALYGIERKPL